MTIDTTCRPFGHSIRVVRAVRDGSGYREEEVEVHRRGSRKTVERAARMVPGFIRAGEIEQYTAEQWVRVFGSGSERSDHGRVAPERAPAKPPVVIRADPPAAASGNGQAKREPAEMPDAKRIPIALVDPSPNQPRQEFDEAELNNLAKSFKAAGLLQPILVRPKLHRYELVAGERRLRAARLAGWSEIPALVQRLDDLAAAEATAIENLQRQNLNPIEEARAYQTLLDNRNVTQAELAGRLGVSQPQIANRLGLLKLPEPWQKRIIAGEIPATHARALAPFRDRPKLVEAIDKEIRDELRMTKTVGTVEDFERLVSQAVSSATREWGRHGKWNNRLHDYVPAFKPTPEQRAELDIITAEVYGRRVELACNVERFDQLMEEHEARWVEKKLAKRDRESEAKRNPNVAKMTPKQREEHEAAQRQRDKEALQQRQRRRAEIRANWWRWCIAQHIAGPQIQLDDLLRMVLAAATEWDDQYGHWNEGLWDILKGCGVKCSRDRWDRRLWSGLVACEDVPGGDAAMGEVLAAFCQRLFWLPGDDGNPEEPARSVPDGDVERVIQQLRVDVAEYWKADKMGPLTEAWLGAHVKEELEQLAKSAKVILAGATKSQAVAALKADSSWQTMPKELAVPERKVKGKKGGRR